MCWFEPNLFAFIRPKLFTPLDQMTKQKRTKWTTELMDEFLKENYPWVYLIPGQEYTGTRSKYWFHCHTHGVYKARWQHVYSALGCQCPRCNAAKAKARRDAITAAFVGQTTSDGLKILEHTSYNQTPADIKRGVIGRAVYRYLCPVCGNDQATARGEDLKRPGNTTHCGCLGKTRQP